MSPQELRCGKARNIHVWWQKVLSAWKMISVFRREISRSGYFVFCSECSAAYSRWWEHILHRLDTDHHHLDTLHSGTHKVNYSKIVRLLDRTFLGVLDSPHPLTYYNFYHLSNAHLKESFFDWQNSKCLMNKF